MNLIKCNSPITNRVIYSRFANIGVVVLISVLSACGGGGATSGGTGSTPPLSQIQGEWNGTTSNNRLITGIVLSDGTYYMFYTQQVGINFGAGVLQGNSTSSAGTFSSANGIDFSLESLSVTPITTSGIYTPNMSFSGSVSYPTNPTISFSSTYSSDYLGTPSLSTVAGTYSTGGGGFVQNAMDSLTLISVSPTGAMSFGTSTGNCNVTGTLSPRTDGNVYNASINFADNAQLACTWGNQTFTGIGYFNTTTPQQRLFNTATQQFLLWVQNSNRTNGYLFVGTKP